MSTAKVQMVKQKHHFYISIMYYWQFSVNSKIKPYEKQAQLHNKLRLFASAVMGSNASQVIVNKMIPDYDMKTNKPNTTLTIVLLPWARFGEYNFA